MPWWANLLVTKTDLALQKSIQQQIEIFELLIRSETFFLLECHGGPHRWLTVAVSLPIVCSLKCIAISESAIKTRAELHPIARKSQLKPATKEVEALHYSSSHSTIFNSTTHCRADDIESVAYWHIPYPCQLLTLTKSRNPTVVGLWVTIPSMYSNSIPTTESWLLINHAIFTSWSRCRGQSCL